MKIPFRSLPYVTTLCLLLGACGSAPSRVEQPSEAPGPRPAEQIDNHYEPVIRRDAAYIDALRAAPPPSHPEVRNGKSEQGDRLELSSRGFVHIGNGRYSNSDDASVHDAIELGTRVGAELALIYRKESTESGKPPSLLAAYYVRFRLLFGATFRDVTNAERESLNIDGGIRIGGVIGDSPASKANLLKNDIVLSLNGTAIGDRVQFQELLKDNAGKTVTLRVLRGSTRIQRVVILGAAPR